MTQQLSAEAIKQAGIAFLRAGEALTALANAMIVVGGEEKQQNLNPQGGVANPPKVEAEATARGRGRKAATEAPPPPAAAAPAAPPPQAPSELDYERDVKPLVIELHNKNVTALGQARAVEFGKALLQRYGADTFAPNGRAGSKPLAPSQYPKLVDEIRRLLSGEDTGVLHGTADNDLGL